VPYISTQGVQTFELFKELLLYENIQEIIKRADLDLNLESLSRHEINQQTMPEYPLPSVRSVIIYSLEEAILTNSPNIQPRHVFLAYMKTFPALQKYVSKQNSSIELLREIVWNEIEEERKTREANYFDLSAPFYPKGGIARQWVYGYTFVLNKFSKDITQDVMQERVKYGIGHAREIDELLSVLGKLSKNNALLVGEPGVGKSSIIKGIAQRINSGDTPLQINGKRIIQLDLNGLIAMSNSEKSVETLVQQSMNELEKAGNVILYIDEIQEIVPAKAEESGHSLAGILLPYILEGKFPIVGSINYADYKKYFYSSESLRSSFENIEISELPPADTLRILETKIKDLERNYGIYVTFPSLTAAIELSQRYVTNRKLPDSAVNTIESAASWAQSQGLKRLTNSDVAKSVALQTNIPVENITAEEATTLIDLENRIKEKVIGQDEAVNAVVESLKRARTDIRDPSKPIGVFLFMGPTGTGKTYLSKVIAEEFFGGDEKIIRLDLSEYQEVNSVSKILGTTNTSNSGQTEVTLLDKVKATPYTVVLLDEIEKANPQILDLFLQLFDEGRLTSNTGEAVNFTNTIIIATSNIGSLKLLQALERDHTMWDEAKQNALLELRGALRPELLNRFDKIIVFSPHNINNLVKITKLLLNKLAERIGKRGISLEWDESIPMLIADKAQEPGMGARPIQRFIQDRIESKVSDEIIRNKLTSGSQVIIRESWLRD
ncbi:ATP-dependent Clp protease ATP-binding subunit, partial [Candidatus Dojkabacteria bacterium]|nr:ATP-dependent Clp protease ATP-binding subunit [Candidatus Dojkabacteria bacterium]